MKLTKIFAAFALAAGLSACATVPQNSVQTDTATRNAPEQEGLVAASVTSSGAATLTATAKSKWRASWMTASLPV